MDNKTSRRQRSLVSYSKQSQRLQDQLRRRTQRAAPTVSNAIRKRGGKSDLKSQIKYLSRWAWEPSELCIRGTVNQRWFDDFRSERIEADTIGVHIVRNGPPTNAHGE
jgi:hypothetical protein